MRLSMAAPVVVGNIWYLRASVPADIKEVAQRQSLSVPVGETARSIQVRDYVKFSLGTRDPKEAKRVFPAAYDVVRTFRLSYATDPQSYLTNRCLPLPGK